jgi:O-antigen biosynthesis protein
MKIFCIGLNKTGTSSLHRALQTLGFRSLHLGGPEVPRAIKRATEEGRGLVEYLGDYDAYSDIWRLSERFDVLDQQYPGSKFILTIRDLDEWLESRRRHVERNVLRTERKLYKGGFLTVDVEAWTRDYHQHHGRVLDYFAERPDDLLVVNIAGGDGYELLCPFLGVDVPAEPFPWDPGAPPADTDRRDAIRLATTTVFRLSLRMLRRLGRRGLSRGHGLWNRAKRRAKAWYLLRRPVESAGARAAPRPVMTRAATEALDVGAVLSRLGDLATRPRVSVIVPIHNAYEDLRRCLASLERNTTARDTEILLVDDASTDPRIAGLLEEWGRLDGVRTLRNEENLGYTRTVNRGIAESSGDVVLLNSDCEVTPRWLQHLTECAYRDAKIATATALSDNAGAFSVPRIGMANDRPHHLSGDEVGRLVTRASQRTAPTTPTGNGFCMYIKRAALADVGLFDAETFPRGYGEEGDFCMRARDAGWINVVDDATIVFHRRSASFGSEKDELMRVGRGRLDARHPDYTRLIREFVKSEALTHVQENVGAAYAASASLARRLRPRILYVHHRGTGGTPATNADLMGALLEGYEPYLLTSDTKVLELSRIEADGAEVLERWSLPNRLRPEEFTDPVYRATLANILTRHAIDLVHIRLFLAHTFDVPSIARALDIPVALSFHDYFLVCPTFHLLDEANRFCAGSCTAGDGECRIPSGWVKGVPHLKHAWVKVWQQEVARMLEDCDAFVTTSPTARTIYVQTYPQLADAPFHVIEHGRDLSFQRVNAMPELGARVRIAIPGALDVHKGARFIEQLRTHDTAGRLEFHFLGKVPEEFRHLGVLHGVYERHEFARKMREIRPAFVGVLSIWAETYSHTLSEAWAAGLPVLVTDLGAPRERVERYGGGWILDHTDPARAYARIVEICNDESEYRRVRSQVGTAGVRTVQAMAADYDHVYRTTFLNRRTARRREPPPRTRHRRAALFVVQGANGNCPPTAHIRMLRRQQHPFVRDELATDCVTVQSFLDGHVDDPDLVIVQRNAIAPEVIEPFLEKIAANAIPLVADVDDNLFAIKASDDHYIEYRSHLAPLERLISAADLVTVSTGHLRDAMAGRARRIAVVPNMLDEFLWFGSPPVSTPIGARPRWQNKPIQTMRSRAVGMRARLARRRCNVIYIGSRTHAEDLALLRPVFERLREWREIDIKLFVVGGEDERPAKDRWYKRVHIPPGFSHHPAFVSWLRSRSSSWHVAVAPLHDTAFNRCKSDLKFLEYSALGLPGVFSDVVPYRGSVRNGETGLLVPNDEEAWSTAILRLAQDVDLRTRIATAARAVVVNERCLWHEAADYLALIRGV